MLGSKILPSLFRTLLGAVGGVLFSVSPAHSETSKPQPQLSLNEVGEIRKAAEAGDASAQGRLGAWYAFGEDGPHNFGEAIKWVRKSAMQQNALAQTCLGEFYALGQGVKQDNTKAVKWFRLAASQGNPIAQSQLGICYVNGSGVPKDYVMAYMWWNLAASSGDEEAAKSRDVITGRMGKEQIAEAQRLSREWKPANPSTDRQNK